MIGVGNRHAGDDAAGLAVADRVRLQAAPLTVAVREIEGDTVAIIDLLDGARAALLVDAVRSGAPPGTIHRAEVGAGPLPALLRRGSSTHAVGVAEVIELARVLGRLPPRLVVYGIEAATFTAGAGLSPPVAAAVPAVAAQVLGDAAAFARA